MTIRDFQFLTDENIDKEIVQLLRSYGLDVFDIKEQELFRMSDKDILTFAFQQNRVVISQDSDFGTLVFQDKVEFYGIVYLRPGHESPEVHVQTMQKIMDTALDFTLPFILVAENTGKAIKIRLRKM